MNTFAPYPTKSIDRPAGNSTSTALLRFVTDGLLATIDSYRLGQLPLHRFAWELHTRIDSLAELDPPSRTLTRLRWLQRTVELLHSELTNRLDNRLTNRADTDGHTAAQSTDRRTELTADEQNDLTVTLRNLTLVLSTLTPPSPLDPAGAARPMSVEPAAIAHVRPTSPLRLVA
jgi:hypothetical protein